MIVGRAEACGRIDALTSDLRRGEGGALMLSGPAGIGKSILLDYAADRAEGMRVIRAKGAPDEAGLTYAGLSQVMTPLLEFLPSLVATQAAAVEAALAIGPAVGADSFPVYAGTLGLFVAAAAVGPIVVIVDDCQWLDSASMRALLFAQRRLQHERVLFLLAARADGAPESVGGDLPTLALPGLELGSAAELVEQRGLRVNDEVLGWLVRATGGNPLALLDLPTYLPAEELAVLAIRSEPAPVGPAVSAAYIRAVADMSSTAKDALLIAAMLDENAMPIVERALRFAGLTVTVLSTAEEAGLLSLANGTVRMRHPLARSAVIQSASAKGRRAAHLACAEGLCASARTVDKEARVWHLADATVGADESIAELLEAHARSAMARTGYGAACLINQRAAELSPAGPARTRRLLAAAEAGLAAGLPHQSQKLLGLLEGDVAASDQCSAAIVHLRGRLQSAAGDPPGAAVVLQHEAERIRDINPALAIQISLDAAFATVLAGDMGRAADAAQLVASIGQALGPGAVAAGDLMVGIVQAMSGAGEDARPRLDAFRAAVDRPQPSVDLLQQLVYLGTAYLMINALDEALTVLDRTVAAARQCGAVGALPFALAMSAATNYRLGAWERGYAQASEATTLADDIGQAPIRPNSQVMLAQIDAARGREKGRSHALTVIREARAMGATFIEAQGLSMLGLLELGIGHPAAAVEPLESCGRLSRQFGVFELGHLQWAAELIEAQVRCGRGAATSETLDIMRGAVHGGTTRLDQAVLARCEGMVSTNADWESHFLRALELHAGRNVRPFELARTELCFGERLRRQRRRKDARLHLTQAWEIFSDLGAAPWALRASQEIAALGGTAPGPASHAVDLLTPQEFQVAMAVTGGATNKEAANSLFLSPKTVEFHLSAIYRRLGLNSRAELANALGERLHAGVAPNG